MPKTITSRDNDLFKKLKKLATRQQERHRCQQTLLDGVHLLQTYLEQVGTPQLLVWCAGEHSREAANLTRGLTHITQIELAATLFHEISPVRTPCGLISLVDIPQRAPPLKPRFGLMLEAIRDPGNLGAVLRSATAAGVDQVWLSADCCDVWSPKVLRGSQGAQWSLPLTEHADLLSVIRNFEGTSFAATSGGTSLYQALLHPPLMLILGNEGTGISTGLQAACSHHIAVPMQNGVESLNVAVAGALCLFEVVRQNGNA